MSNHLLTEKNRFPDAPPTVYLGNELISISTITREQWLKIMSAGLDVDNLPLLDAAYNLSKSSFNGQNGAATRRTGERYFDHVKAVAFTGTHELGDISLDHAIARLFHDTPEDTRIQDAVLRATFGKNVADIVALVTNPPKSNDKARNELLKRIHYLAIKDNEGASKVKVSDRIDNHRSEELVLIMNKTLPVDILTKEMLDRGMRKADESGKHILPMAQNLGGKFESSFRESLADFQKATHELKDSIQ